MKRKARKSIGMVFTLFGFTFLDALSLLGLLQYKSPEFAFTCVAVLITVTLIGTFLLFND